MNRAFAGVAVLSLGLGCVQLGMLPPSCPASGGPPWRELTSEHFALRTDLATDDARAVLLDLERLRAAMLRMVWKTTKGPPQRYLAIALFSKAEFGEYFNANYDGFATQDDFDRMFITYGELTRQTHSVIAHELAHTVSAYFLPRQPRWLAEGIACVLETIHVDEERHDVVFGDPGDRLLPLFKHQARQIPTKELFDWKSDSEDPRELGSFYGTTWLLVHDLINNHTAQFADLQRRMSGGESFRTAWSKAFAGVSFESLDDELTTYLRDGRYLRLRAPAPEVNARFKETVLTDAEAHATRARLAALGLTHPFLRPRSDNPAKVRERLHAELSEALRQESGNGLALSLSAATGAKGERASLARRATELAPGDWRSWFVLSQFLGADPSVKSEREAALQHLVEMAPDNPRALNNAAWDLASQGKSSQALPLAARAVKLDPGNPSILDTYATAALGVHRCEEAVDAERAAIDRVPDERRDLAVEFRKRLEAFERACALDGRLQTEKPANDAAAADGQ